MSNTPRLSVILITRNEAHQIERCLRSVAFADELVVLDSGSSDDTVGVARRLGARVEVSADWPGFGVQKNRALDLARGQWILSIDADEEVDDQLREEILRTLQAPTHKAYWIDRKSCFGGTVLRYGDWRGDRVLRLFRKDAGRFSCDQVHERVVCEAPAGHLNGSLVHYTIESLDDALGKARRYAAPGAVRVAERGRGGLPSAALHGGWTFMRGYLLRGGFLDGRKGLLLAGVNAYGTWLRYRMAGEIRTQKRAKKRGPSPE